MKYILPLLLIFVQPLHAMTLFVAKNIITLETSQANVESILIEDNLIVDLGQADELISRYGLTENDINRQFSEQIIVPGFINQHEHPWLSALSLSTEVIAIEDWNFGGRYFPKATSQETYRKRLAETIANFDAAKGTLFSWGYHELWHGKLNRAILDELTQSLPVVVWQRSIHEFYFNSKALQHFGINEQSISKLPASALSQIDLQNGHFYEQGAIAVLPFIIREIAEPKRYIGALQQFESYLHDAGSTLLVEPGAMTYPQLFEAQFNVLGKESSPLRADYIVDGRSLFLAKGSKALAEVDAIIAAKKSVNSRFYPKQIKLFADGAIFSQLMQMRDGYLDGHSGEWLMDPESLSEAFKLFWDAGYQIHIHQNGDLGIDKILDIVEQNMARHPREDHRTVLVHFGFSDKDQLQRIKNLGVIVSANPYYLSALGEKYSHFGIGPVRAKDMVRLGDLQREGISYSLHADMPMAPGQPLFLMWSAVNRIGDSGQVIGPDQRISPEQALKAVTLDAAYSMQLDVERGSLAKGKLANMTVLAENPLTVDPMHIKDIKVVATIHEGSVHSIP